MTEPDKDDPARQAVQTLRAVILSMNRAEDSSPLYARQAEALSALLDVEEILNAQERQCRALEEKARAAQAWETEKARYVLERLPPGLFLYSLKEECAKDEPHHALCPACYQKAVKSILQYEALSSDNGRFFCPECGVSLPYGAPPSSGRATSTPIPGENPEAAMRS
ncbi:MAG: hypothetical protein RBR34_03100 [Rhodospirillaceae bacterium]|nr:hypothetical protein [Rhodospirillaceae bacterium]